VPSSPVYYRYTGTQPALSYRYTAAGLDLGSTFYKECNSALGAAPGAGVFQAVTVNAASAEAQNYANWNKHYRTRMLMMKSSVSLAFKSVDDKFRVGYSTISETTATEGSDFLDVRDFDATQKGRFYTAFNAASPAAYTPLRGALSKAGKYFANKAPGQAVDPVQYSCQKNFTILSTDGYWNTNDESATYGPFDLNGANVGQQDDRVARPMLDGQSTLVTVTEVLGKKIERQQWTTTQTHARTLTRNIVTVAASGCGNNKVLVTTQSQVATETETLTTVAERDVTTSTTRVTTTLDGGTPQVTDTPNNSSVPVGSPSTTSSSSATAFANSGSPTTSCANANNPPFPPGGGPNTTAATAGAWSALSPANPAPAVVVLSSTSVPDPSSTQTPVTNGSSDSLADVAMYYYKTDLRTDTLGNCRGALGSDVCANDPAAMPWQRMSTFTLGLGVSGTLNYQADYDTALSGDFFDIRQGTKNWPAPSSGPQRIDDLWHAAVDGQGKYFSAKNPTSLAQSLKAALNSISEKLGSGSAAATSTLKPIAGDDDIFIAQYRSAVWTGDLLAFKINLVDGTVQETQVNAAGDTVSAARWSAAAQLDAKVAAGSARRIVYRSGAALKDFSFANLRTDGLDALFANACGKSPALSQCADLLQADKDIANNGDNLVNWLRGAKFAVFRDRKSALGDIGNAAPVYVGVPAFLYTEHNYAVFKSQKASRRKVVYAAANDGMLHAFDAATGDELWAFIPREVMPRLYRLADSDYASRHLYTVDGSPVVGDIYVGGAWKTILVGGLGAGGQAYYALDITDPDNPKPLWEFTDAALGLTFGNPVITKRANGSWVVAFTSGYNNADGKGYLFVLDADSGAQVVGKLSTNTGDSANPSGLAKLNAWVDSDIDNTALRFYAGDLLGNVWRFRVDAASPDSPVVRLASLVANGKPQPITVQPLLAEVESGGSRRAVVYVGTGRYLGTSDLANSDVQSVYALKDTLDNTGLGDVRASGTLVRQTLSTSADGTSRTVTGNAVDWTLKNGWFIDLPSPGERVNIDLQVVFNVLTVATNIPKADACTAGGSSWLYRFDIASGASLHPSGLDGIGNAGVLLGGKQIVGSTSYQLPSGVVITHNRYADGSGGKGGEDYTSASSGPARRTSWRELVD
jgi:type IV pilus assembly protein PilY1